MAPRFIPLDSAMPKPMGFNSGCCGRAFRNDERTDLRGTDVETYNDFLSASHVTFSFIGSIRLRLQDHLVLETEIHLNGLRIVFLNLCLQLEVTSPPGPEFTRSQIHKQRFAQGHYGNLAGIVHVDFGEFALTMQLFHDREVEIDLLLVCLRFIEFKPVQRSGN